jgi:hypothetical protein
MDFKHPSGGGVFTDKFGGEIFIERGLNRLEENIIMQI